MADKPSVIDVLAKAAEERRTARKQLRVTADALAEQLVENLRRGDEVSLPGGPTYSVDNVTWWVGEHGPPDEAEIFLSPSTEKALIRADGERQVALGDPRSTYFDDEGIPYGVVGRTLYSSAALGTADKERYAYGRATDEELLSFLSEAKALATAFARKLRIEAKRFRQETEALADKQAGE